MSLPTLDEAAIAARAVADQILFPAAAQVDQSVLVPRSHLAALGDAGLHGLYGPVDVGLGADQVSARPVMEAVSGGCGATSFVWQQHHGAVRRFAAGDGPARERWLAPACSGEVMAGIGFAYLRRPGPPLVRATPVGDGWRLDGRAPWITGWGLIDILVVMARTDDDRVVTVVFDRLDRPELRAEGPQRLSVLGATGTVAVNFEGAVASVEDVVRVEEGASWAARDALGAAFPGPAPLGIAERAIRLLGESSSGGAAGAAITLSDELETTRARTDAAGRRLYAAAASSTDVAGAIAGGVAERDRGLALARRATDALVAASGGGAMSLAHPAQRLSREATFYLVQAQSADLRAATLARLTSV
jgi:alkylation response protein AidB-like acyl-CoA dehydrogenase